MRLSFGVLVVLLVVVPSIIALLFGLVAFRKRWAPLSFRCRRCGGEFRRKPHLDFPTVCPLCRARDWNS